MRTATLSILLCGTTWITGCVHPAGDTAIYRGEFDRLAPVSTRPAGVGMDTGDTLTLLEAMAITNRDNERLALAGEDYVQALIEKDRAFSAFLPTISLVPGWVLVEDFANQNTFDLPARLQFGVNGYRDAARLRSAGLRADQRRELMLDLQAALLLEVTYTYYGVLKSEQSVIVLSNSLKIQEEHVQDITDKLQQGLARKLDLEQSRAQSAHTKVQLTDAKNRVATGRTTLAFLLGVPYLRARLTRQPPVAIQDETLESFLETARVQRRDLQAVHLAARAAREDVETAIGQYFPSVSINLDAFLHRETFPTQSDFTGVLGLNLPLFTGGRIYADVRQAWSRHRQSMLQESLLARQVNEQVERAYNDLEASRQRVRDLQTEVAAARENARIANDAYQVQLATNLDQLDALDRKLAAELRFENEEYDTLIYYLNLRRMSGLPLVPTPTRS